jgi:hypothetical protein
MSPGILASRELPSMAAVGRRVPLPRTTPPARLGRRRVASRPATAGRVECTPFPRPLPSMLRVSGGTDHARVSAGPGDDHRAPPLKARARAVGFRAPGPVGRAAADSGRAGHRAFLAAGTPDRGPPGSRSTTAGSISASRRISPRAVASRSTPASPYRFDGPCGRDAGRPSRDRPAGPASKALGLACWMGRASSRRLAGLRGSPPERPGRPGWPRSS